VDALVVDIVIDMRAHPGNTLPVHMNFERTMLEFRADWRRLWSLYGQGPDGWPHYQKLIQSLRIPQLQIPLASNGGSATHTFKARVLAAALNTPLANQYRA
jgi:hypothetical protein